MISGTPRANGLALGELQVSFLTPANESPRISVKLAFIDTKTGRTHGWTTAGYSSGGFPWSKEVQDKLSDLAAQIEKEVAVLHLDNSGGEVVEPQLTGLGEHLTSDGEIEAPPV